MKTVLLIVALVLALASVSLSQGTSGPSVDFAIAISSADLVCSTARDCTTVKTSCTTLDCGSPVNTTAAVRVNTELSSACAAYVYVSDSSCPAMYSTCLDSVCVNLPLPGPVVVSQAAQTCKSSDECATFQINCDGTPCCGNVGVVGVSAANLATFEATWNSTCFGVTQHDCSMLGCASFYPQPTCVEGYCTVNNASAILVDPVVPTCDISLRPSSQCQCVSTTTVSLNGAVSGVITSEWVCPVTCLGTPPQGCYCSAASGVSFDSTSSLQWICEAAACENSTIPAGGSSSSCYCGVNAGYVSGVNTAGPSLAASAQLTAQWICPATPCCTGDVLLASAPCNSFDANIACVTNLDNSCSWNYTCPPPNPCTCDNLPLPVLDATIDGCTTAQANFYCVQNLGVSSTGEVVPIGTTVGVSTGTVGPATAKRQTADPSILPAVECASWTHTCPGTPGDLQCVADYSCGGGCYDASVPRPLYACIQLYDPVIACEQGCLERHGACTPTIAGDVKKCDWVKSLDYDICVAGCKGIAPPTQDNCTYLGDRCNCESKGCGWCESTVYLDQPVTVSPTGAPVTSIPTGYCSSLNSQFQCLYADAAFSTSGAVVGSATGSSTGSSTGGQVSSTCNIVVPPEPVPLPVDPRLVEITACLADQRCVSNTDLNTDIAAAAQSAPANSVSSIFYIVVTLVIRADGGVVNLAVDVSGDHEPTSVETVGVCDVLVNTMSARLKFQKDRVESCTLAKVSGTPSQKRAAVTNSYIANMRINEPDTIQSGSATVLAPALVFVVSAALAQ